MGALTTMNAENPPPMPERWWVSVPELSDAFQVEMAQGDLVRGLWWGNQIVGRARRTSVQPVRWEALGRDDVPLPNDDQSDGLHSTAEAALVKARDAWRQRVVTVSERLGEDYWTEPRPAAGVESLWLGRIHLGYVRLSSDGTYEAFTTSDDPIGRNYPTREDSLLAVRGLWRAHLHRILRITQRPN